MKGHLPSLEAAQFGAGHSPDDGGEFPEVVEGGADELQGAFSQGDTRLCIGQYGPLSKRFFTARLLVFVITWRFATRIPGGSRGLAVSKREPHLRFRQDAHEGLKHGHGTIVRI